jgi:hypothetical protein
MLGSAVGEHGWRNIWAWASNAVDCPQRVPAMVFDRDTAFACDGSGSTRSASAGRASSGPYSGRSRCRSVRACLRTHTGRCASTGVRPNGPVTLSPRRRLTDIWRIALILPIENSLPEFSCGSVDIKRTSRRTREMTLDQILKQKTVPTSVSSSDVTLEGAIEPDGDEAFIRLYPNSLIRTTYYLVQKTDVRAGSVYKWKPEELAVGGFVGQERYNLELSASAVVQSVEIATVQAKDSKATASASAAARSANVPVHAPRQSPTGGCSPSPPPCDCG